MNNSVIVKIRDFKLLEKGWCYGEGLNISDRVLNMAEALAIKILSYGFNKLDAFPGINGEVRVTAYKDNHYLEFTIEKEESVSFLYEIDDVEMEYLEKLSFEKCSPIIKRLSHLCNSYGSFTKNSTIKLVVDSKVSHSNRHPMAVFPFFVKNAQKSPVNVFANTYRTTTEEFVGTLLFSGNLVHPFYHLITQSMTPQANPGIFVIET